jgi:hypothetical protein
VSSLFDTPIVALLTTFAVFFALWLLGLQGLVARMRESAEAGITKPMAWYEYLYPNAYDTLLLSPELARVLTGVGILLAFIGVATAGGALLLRRRDI